MFRYEFKYLVPVSRIDTLRRRIVPFVQEDTFAGRRADHQYVVRSIYYETTGYRSYVEKLAGIERRVKVRIRGYNRPEPESSVFLELKRKHGPFIRKNRAPVLWSELPDLLRDRDVERHVRVRRAFELGKEDARQFFYQVIGKGMSPAILIAYEREAYFATFDRRIRLTFDNASMMLKGWTVTDPQGYDTKVALSNMNTAARPSAALFVIPTKVAAPN